MAKLKVKLLKGNSPDIVSSNINSLKENGHSHQHATHLALKHSSKHTASKMKKIKSKVIKKMDQVKVGEGGY